MAGRTPALQQNSGADTEHSPGGANFWREVRRKIFFVETGEGFQQGDLVEAWPTAVQNPHPKPVVDNGQLFAVVDLSLVGDSELVG